MVGTNVRHLPNMSHGFPPPSSHSIQHAEGVPLAHPSLSKSSSPSMAHVGKLYHQEHRIRAAPPPAPSNNRMLPPHLPPHETSSLQVPLANHRMPPQQTPHLGLPPSLPAREINEWHHPRPPPCYETPISHQHQSSLASHSYNSSNVTTPPTVYTFHHPMEINANVSSSSNCVCSSCNSFNNNRPPDYPPQLPTPPNLPHHSTQQPWHQQQHSNQSFPSPGHSGSVGGGSSSGGGGGGVHHDYYSSPTSANNSTPSFQGSNIPTSLTSHERNNNEPSMVSPSRYTGSGNSHGTPEPSRSSDIMPNDPREWSANDVIRWIQWASITFKLRNLHPERFQMNGKALCLMDLSMFLYRVPDGGERLYQDFQGRLQKALCQDKMR